MCDCVSMPLTATVHNNRGLSGGQVLPYISHRVMWGGGGGGGGVGTPLNKPYCYVPPPPPPRAGFLHCFGLKTGIDFTRFGLESGTV